MTKPSISVRNGRYVVTGGGEPEFSCKSAAVAREEYEARCEETGVEPEALDLEAMAPDQPVPEPEPEPAPEIVDREYLDAVSCLRDRPQDVWFEYDAGSWRVTRDGRSDGPFDTYAEATAFARGLE